jgi:hypothetical protein
MTTLGIVDCCDATHCNIGHLPPGQAAGYSTGTGDVRWTAQDWKNHPGAVRIDQDPDASDFTADVLDVEAGAATTADCAPWAIHACRAFTSAARPGQRTPAIYTSQGNVTAVVNALIAGGVAGGVSMWIANWDLDRAQAVAIVEAGSGPFPIVGVQYNDAGLYDESVFSATWLANVSQKGPIMSATGYASWDQADKNAFFQDLSYYGSRLYWNKSAATDWGTPATHQNIASAYGGLTQIPLGATPLGQISQAIADGCPDVNDIVTGVIAGLPPGLAADVATAIAPILATAVEAGVDAAMSKAFPPPV